MNRILDFILHSWLGLALPRKPDLTNSPRDGKVPGTSEFQGKENNMEAAISSGGVYKEATPYETEQILSWIESGDFLRGPIPGVKRYFIEQLDSGKAQVLTETNDEGDGLASGEWSRSKQTFSSVTAAQGHCGVCRIGVHGTIITVTVEGDEIRDA
jgi:hypothetical protein